MPKLAKKVYCEICGNLAELKCGQCHRVHYCCIEHETLDKESIHNKICHYFKELRPSKPPISQEERKKRENKRIEILVSHAFK